MNDILLLLKNKKVLIAGVIAAIMLVALGVYIGGFISSIEKRGGETTREDVPSDVQIPEVGQELEDKSIAIPIGTTEVVAGSASKLRIYNISGVNDAFEPSTIIGKVGDTIQINFTAVDKEYDIIFPDYSLKQSAKKGEQKRLEFQATVDGKFTYYCEICGGPDSSAKGYIIITK
jgi:plastocyanin